MKTMTLLRYAALATLLAGALPAPASAQFGSLKRRLKERIVEKVVAQMAGGDSSSSSASTPTASPATASMAPGEPGRARKPMRTSGPAREPGPAFDEYVLEMTPDLLDRLARSLVAEATERKLIAEGKKKILTRQAYGACVQQIIVGTAEGKQAYKELSTALASGSQEASSKAAQVFDARMKELTRPRCGPDPSEAGSLRSGEYDRILNAGVSAFGLGERQYAILKERVAPFCAVTNPSELLASGYVYGKGETDVLRARCAALLPLLKA